ncbi:MAG: TetR/AcrR family transcriptional regulator [Candidatus Dormibacteria bacterium]
MSIKSDRSYNSPQRDEQANATRRHILRAAGELFSKSGFPAATMKGIASHAAVSLATVYLYFPGKAALVAALAEDVAASPDLSVEQVEREGDPVQQLRIASQIIRRLNERAWPVADILRSAQGTDDGLAEIWRLWKERHLTAIRRAVASLESCGALSGAVTLDGAVDVFYAVAGTDVYRALVRERGWSPDHYEQWLFGLACRELLGKAAT